MSAGMDREALRAVMDAEIGRRSRLHVDALANVESGARAQCCGQEMARRREWATKCEESMRKMIDAQTAVVELYAQRDALVEALPDPDTLAQCLLDGAQVYVEKSNEADARGRDEQAERFWQKALDLRRRAETARAALSRCGGET